MSLSEMMDLDLFAGGGGLAIGLVAAGFRPLELYEKDTVACDTLRRNARYNGSLLSANVHEEDVINVEWRHLQDRVRLLAAGAPCQPFSLAGRHKAANDGRNLFPEVVRAVRETRPAAVMIENVRGLLRQDFAPYFEYILRHLECPSIQPMQGEMWADHDQRIRRHQCSVGYRPEYWISRTLLNAADFGVAQVRMRVFVVATRHDLPPFRFPAATHSKYVLMCSQADGSYWKRHGLKPPAAKFPRPVELSGDKLLPWRTVRDEIRTLPDPAGTQKHALANHWVIPGARSYPGHSGSLWDWPAKTVKAGVHGVPGGENTLSEQNGTVRYFTLRELARLQSFPDEHVFSGARIHVTRQIGNAVPCKLAEVIARPLFQLIQANLIDEKECGGHHVAAASGI